jgi:hypothetical protein
MVRFVYSKDGTTVHGRVVLAGPIYPNMPVTTITS